VSGSQPAYFSIRRSRAHRESLSARISTPGQDQEVAKHRLRGDPQSLRDTIRGRLRTSRKLVQQQKGYQRPPAERVDRARYRDARSGAPRPSWRSTTARKDDLRRAPGQGRKGLEEEDLPASLSASASGRRRLRTRVEGALVENPTPRKIPVPVQRDDPVLDLLQDGHEVDRVDGERDEQGQGVPAVPPWRGRTDLPEREAACSNQHRSRADSRIARSGARGTKGGPGGGGGPTAPAR